MYVKFSFSFKSPTDNGHAVSADFSQIEKRDTFNIFLGNLQYLTIFNNLNNLYLVAQISKPTARWTCRQNHRWTFRCEPSLGISWVRKPVLFELVAVGVDVKTGGENERETMWIKKRSRNEESLEMLGRERKSFRLYFSGCSFRRHSWI